MTPIDYAIDSVRVAAGKLEAAAAETAAVQATALATAAAALAATPPVLTIAAPAAAAEGNSGAKQFVFVASLSKTWTSPIAVAWATSGTGSSPADATDFTGGVFPSGTFTFAAGETSKNIVVSVAGDTTIEPSENFLLTATPTLQLGAVTATATIVNDDNTALPDAPTLTATGGDGKVTLTWTDGATGGAAITGHKLYAGASADTISLVGTITTGSPYIDTPVTNGTKRYYALSAVNSVGEGPRSNVANATPSAGLAPTTAPSAALSSDQTTYTATPGTWPSGTTVTAKWYRDGVAISPAVTALTMARNASTDDGRYMQYIEIGNGSVQNPSNALLQGSSTTYYSDDFTGTDGTSLNGLHGWTNVQGNGNAFAIQSNDLVQAANGNDSFFKHPTGGSDFEFEFEACMLKPTGVTTGYKPLKVRYTDRDNLIAVDVDNNNWHISTRIAGVETALQSYVSRNFNDHDKIKIRCQGSRLRFYVNSVEAYESATVNGGAGYDISGVPLASFVAIAQPYDSGSGAVFPRVFAYSTAIYSLPSDGVSVTPGIVTLNSTPGHQAITVSGTFQGGVTQPQALVMSSTGKVLQDWVNVPVSGQTFSGTLPELSQLAEGDTVQVWMRDASLKSVTIKAPQYVKVQWHAMQADFGLNTQGISLYDRATIFSDLVKSASLGLTGSGIFFTNIYPASIGLSAPLTGTAAASASDVGLDTDGWLTKVPVASPWPADTKACLLFNDDGRGFYAENAGVYDVTFTPNLDWAFMGASDIAVSNYNLAAGTAVLTVTPGKTGNAARRLVFNSYNGIANTFPPKGQRLFKMKRRGEAGALTANCLSSIRGLTSGVKAGAGEFRGAQRWMTPNDINTPSIAGREYLNTRQAVDENHLGYLITTGPLTIGDMLDSCVRARNHLWLNIPDTAAPEMVLYYANYLNTNMPAGMKVFVEYSNEIAFNFAPAFSQYYRLDHRAQAAGVGYRTQLAREIKAKVALPFASVFGKDNTRWNLIVGEQAAKYQNGDDNSDYAVAELLDEGDLWQWTRGMCIAAYVGGGFNYDFSGTGGVGPAGGFMSKASRDKAGVDDEGFKTDFFAAQRIMSDWTRDNYLNTFANALARYTAKKGAPRGQIPPFIYEYSWQHSDEKSNNFVSVTGSVSGNTFTVSYNGQAPVRVGDQLLGPIAVVTYDPNNNPIYTQITGQLTGTTGGVGTYSVNNTQTTVNSRWECNGAVFVGSISGTTFTVTAVMSGTITTGRVNRSIIATVTASSTGASGGAGTYTLDQSFSMASTTVNSANNVYANAAGTVIAQSLHDPRAGAAVNYMDAWIRKVGGIACHFDHVGSAPTNLHNYGGGSNWGYLTQVGNESTDSPYKETAADMLANG